MGVYFGGAFISKGRLLLETEKNYFKVNNTYHIEIYYIFYHVFDLGVGVYFGGAFIVSNKNITYAFISGGFYSELVFNRGNTVSE